MFFFAFLRVNIFGNRGELISCCFRGCNKGRLIKVDRERAKERGTDGHNGTIVACMGRA